MSTSEFPSDSDTWGDTGVSIWGGDGFQDTQLVAHWTGGPLHLQMGECPGVAVTTGPTPGSGKEYRDCPGHLTMLPWGTWNGVCAAQLGGEGCWEEGVLTGNGSPTCTSGIELKSSSDQSPCFTHGKRRRWGRTQLVLGHMARRRQSQHRSWISKSLSPVVFPPVVCCLQKSNTECRKTQLSYQICH